MPATSPSTPLKGDSENPEFLAADLLGPDGRFVEDYLSAPVAGRHADMALAVDVGLSRHGLGESTLWAGEGSGWMTSKCSTHFRLSVWNRR